LEKQCIHERIYLLNCVQKKGSYKECEGEANPFLRCAFEYGLHFAMKNNNGEKPRIMDFQEYETLQKNLKTKFTKIWERHDHKLKNPNSIEFHQKSCYSPDFILNLCYSQKWFLKKV
jgi:hypothetical protein